MMFDIRDCLPPDFLNVSAAEIESVFPRPTLVHLPGLRPEPLFVSLLLHGNEDVGLKAIQQVLRRLESQQLPRALSLFIGNVTAAKHGLRRLPGQVDYNRVWPGSDHEVEPELIMMHSIVEQMRARDVFASLDLHNNTGTNPHYACICSTANRHLQLASLFSRTVVYFTRPRGVQTMAFSQICPSVTCECGKVGDASGVDRAAELVLACLHLLEIPDHPVPAGDAHLFHTVATVKVPEEVSMGFADDPADLIFPANLDHMNFCEVGPGAEIACRPPHSVARLQVLNEAGEDVHSEYISVVGNSLRLKKRVLPSMLTLDQRVIRQDCLCYFMERYDV
ncbi:M14 family metallopeptidase [Planctomicrobium sp. SH661]|uniref:M14 family metallopeptidase n=1 Tax=Planctomicrobium sp. SH661 TaxID=3448124 RepID=UPI003F5C09FE